MISSVSYVPSSNRRTNSNWNGVCGRASFVVTPYSSKGLLSISNIFPLDDKRIISGFILSIFAIICFNSSNVVVSATSVNIVCLPRRICK